MSEMMTKADLEQRRMERGRLYAAYMANQGTPLEPTPEPEPAPKKPGRLARAIAAAQNRRALFRRHPRLLRLVQRLDAHSAAAEKREKRAREKVLTGRPALQRLMGERG